MTFRGLADADQPHLSVDGMSEAGPNLSHWPGNRTPAQFRADLSTGICLQFARASPDERRTFLGGVRWVLNDHYDTDGFLSLLAVLRPEVALARAEVCLAAAGTGDFQQLLTPRAFAIDRTVIRLTDAECSPIAAQFAGLEPAEQAFACYSWLLEHAEEILDGPAARWSPCWVGELAEVEADIHAGLVGEGVERQVQADLGLAIVSSSRPLHRMALNTLAGAYRVLHFYRDRAGDQLRCRFHDRTESWFDLVTIKPPPRRDLRPLAHELQRLEGDSTPHRWCADPPDQPIPELYFGIDEPQIYGTLTRTLGPSQLTSARIQDAFLEFFAQS